MEGKQLLQYIIDTSDVVLAKRQEATEYLASLRAELEKNYADGVAVSRKEYIELRAELDELKGESSMEMRGCEIHNIKWFTNTDNECPVCKLRAENERLKAVYSRVVEVEQKWRGNCAVRGMGIYLDLLNELRGVLEKWSKDA